MPPAVPLIKLNNGQSMPAFGLGTWQMDESEAETAVKQAIDLGYRHFDTAFIYHNEVAIGKAIRQKIQEGVVKREDIFVVSKLWNTCHARSEVLPACRRSQRYLSLGHIDLYLVHWPFGVKSKTESGNPQVFDSFDDTSLEDTWREMEKCVDEGLVRSIGLSNFNSVQVLRIVNIARIKPVCNQIEVHVGFHQRPLIQFCRERNVEVVGYCPLGAPNRPVKRRNEKTVLDQPAVMQMASAHGKTPAQIALRYLVQLGVTPIPKSNTKQHLKDNINIFDFELSKVEMDTLDGLNSEDRIMMYPLCAHNDASKEREKQIRNYVLSRYMQYVQQYADVLEKRFPTAIRVYRVFTIGVKDFYNDLKVFLALFHKVNLTSKGLEALTRRELEIYHKMSKDMIRVAPVLLSSALPFSNYVIFPLAYYFPRHLLTSHFWSLQQRHEFALIEHRNRLRHYKGVFRSLQWHMEDLKDHKLFPQWECVIRLLGSGLHPSPKQVLECMSLFAESPYHLNCIYSSHVKELLRSQGMHTGWRRRRRLAERARLIQLLDNAICQEGGVSNLSQDDIRAACLFRGLNPANMKREDMEAWLQDWLLVSQNVSQDCRSLLLHSPILLAYNHPSNWVLRQ